MEDCSWAGCAGLCVTDAASVCCTDQLVGDTVMLDCQLIDPCADGNNANCQPAEQECPALGDCPLLCDFGFARDANDCELCECAANPNVEGPCPDFTDPTVIIFSPDAAECDEIPGWFGVRTLEEAAPMFACRDGDIIYKNADCGCGCYAP